MEHDIQQRRKLIDRAYNAYQDSLEQRLNVPVDMAIFALQDGYTPQCRTYLTAQLLFSGKARTTDRPARTIAEHLDITERTVYRHFEWLIERDWMGKDERNGWYFFRGIDFIRDVEGWTSKRATTLKNEHLTDLKGFFTASIVRSIAHTRSNRNKTGRQQKGRPLQTYCDISLRTIQSVFGVSRSTAQCYLKKAKQQNLLNVLINMKQIKITAKELERIREKVKPYQDHSNVACTYELFGSKETIEARPQQLRTYFGNVYVQLPNMMKSFVHLRNRTC